MENDLILDLDGVLVNSTEIGMRSIIEAVKLHKCKVPSIKQLKALWGHHLESEMLPALAKELSWPNGCEMGILNSFHEIAGKRKYPPQDGLSAQLLAISKRRKLGIASNRDLPSLIFRLEEQGINPDWFEHIQGADEGIFKPDPRIFKAFWNGAGFKPQTTIFVGDSITYDLAAAKAHQPELRFVAITSGMHSFGEFVRAGVKCQNIFKTLQEALLVRYLF